MMKNKSGQSMVEALFVVVFTTIIMFAFLQVCIMVVDDMTANEAAFVGMRSAAVTKKADRRDEAEKWIKNYLFLFYPFTVSESLSRLKGSFGLSNHETVSNRMSGSQGGEQEEEVISSENGENFVTLHIPASQSRKSTDYSGNIVTDHTVKIYYFTRVMFGSLVANSASKRENADKITGKSGSRRYQSARNRMVPSPDAAFYYKAYPGAEKFKNRDLLSLLEDD